MGAPGVQIEGLAELRRGLRRLEDKEALTGVRLALKSGAEVVAEAARARVPVRSGRARKSIRARASGNKALVVGGGRQAVYYGWLEFGRRKRGGRPADGRYIIPSLQDNEQKVVDVVADRLAAELRKAGF